MSNHTPTPWTEHMVNTATVNIRAGEISIAAVYRHIGSPVLQDRAGEGDNNAAFIVRACNSHEALVAAATRALGYTDDTKDGEALKQELLAALKLAKS